MATLRSTRSVDSHRATPASAYTRATLTRLTTPARTHLATRSRRARQRKSRLWEKRREMAKNAVFAHPCTDPPTLLCLGCGATRCLGYRAGHPPASRCGVPSYARTRASTPANPAKQATQVTPFLRGARCTQATDEQRPASAITHSHTLRTHYTISPPFRRGTSLNLACHWSTQIIGR